MHGETIVTVEAVIKEGPGAGVMSRKTVFEREAVGAESLDFDTKGGAEGWGLELTEGEKYPRRTEPHETTNGQGKKVRISLILLGLH